MRADHERFRNHDPCPIPHLQQRSRFCGIQRNRFLAQHVLARLRGAYRPRYVQVIRQRVIDDFDVVILEQLVIRAIRSLDPQLVACRARFGAVPRGNSDHAAGRTRLNRRNHLGDRDAGCAQNSPFVHGAENTGCIHS